MLKGNAVGDAGGAGLKPRQVFRGAGDLASCDPAPLNCLDAECRLAAARSIAARPVRGSISINSVSREEI